MRDLLSTVDLLVDARPPVQVSVGEVIYPPGGRLGPRWQQDLQLLLVHSGSASVSADGQVRPPLPAGWVGLLLPGHREEFAFATSGPTHHSWVQIRLPARPAAALEGLAKLPAAIPASTALTELVGEAVAASRTPLSTSARLLGALAAAAIWRYVGDAESRGEGEDSDMVGRARGYLHAHAADPSVDLPQVAEAAHVSPPHLVRRFRSELGTTPMAYLWQRRVGIGVDLLTHTGLPVGEIARRSGFKSVYHFSRKVRQETGLPPTELRRDRWEGERRGLAREL
jgi:AraC-like DNA-binding protein